LKRDVRAVANIAMTIGRGKAMRRLTSQFLLTVLFLAGATAAETVLHSLFLEGTVVRAQRLRQGFKYVTKIELREDLPTEAVRARRFCGDWQDRINEFRGKHIRVNLLFKEYAPNECEKITAIELLK
jgi:hypothetical protein